MSIITFSQNKLHLISIVILISHQERVSDLQVWQPIGVGGKTLYDYQIKSESNDVSMFFSEKRF